MAIWPTRQHWGETDSDDALARAFQNGQSDAFDVLYERYSPRLYAYAYRLIGNQEDAEDVAHETLVKAWSNLAWYQEGNFRAWLFAIAHNTINDHFRSGGRSRDIPLEAHAVLPSPASTEDAALDQVQIAGIVEILGGFPEIQRAIIAMKLSGLKHSEIAVALGKSEAAVAQEYCRSIKKLAATSSGGPDQTMQATRRRS